MNRSARRSGPGEGLLIIAAVLVVLAMGTHYLIGWMVERAVAVNLAVLNAQAAEFDQRALAIADQQELMHQDIKQHECQLRSMMPTSRSAPERSRQVLVTAYTCNDGDKKQGDAGYCVTASGKVLHQGDAWRYVAADPAHYKFGQQLHIDGVGPVIVADTGRLVKGPNRLDLFVGETDIGLANTWGARWKNVRI